MLDAQYMVARLMSRPARPPDHWTPEQITPWAAIMARPHAQSTMLSYALDGWRRLSAKAGALDVTEAGGR